MQEAVRTTFRTLVDFLPLELEKMDLSRWTESVVRYFYCRILHESFPAVDQFVECHKIDLVLRQGPASAFVEFKFYRHPKRHHPYDGSVLGFKGGPGLKNLTEFQCCVEQLHDRLPKSGLSKYIVLVYADPTNGERPKLRFSNQYDPYHHPNEIVPLLLLESSVIKAADATIRAQLYEVG